MSMEKRGSRRQSSKRRDIATSHVILTPGAEAADRWRTALGLSAVPKWQAEIAIEASADTAFELNIYPEEWGFAFRHDGRCSWIRVTDIPFVHVQDDFELLGRTPDLLAIGETIAELEITHAISFQRAHARVRTNIPKAAEVVRKWILQPLPYSVVRKTVELCGNEMHDGICCTLVRGHDGPHEYRGIDGRGQLRWH